MPVTACAIPRASTTPPQVVRDDRSLAVMASIPLPMAYGTSAIASHHRVA